MTIADLTLTLFTLCNSLRVVAYVPQIARAVTDRGGAEAISFGTWGLFLVSHGSAMAYALVNKEDCAMASVFLCNAIGCSAIILIAAWKRSRYRSRQIEETMRSRARIGASLIQVHQGAAAGIDPSLGRSLGIASDQLCSHASLIAPTELLDRRTNQLAGTQPSIR